MLSSLPVLGVSEFVAFTNQTLEYAYPFVSIEGELANFRVSKNKWVYFDLKDADAQVKCFGTVYMLKHQLEDGMMVQVSGSPRLHPQFGFSVTLQSIQPVGEGSINKAAKLLEIKLQKEGLFDESRKRPIPYPPQKIGLVTSSESAAYADFIKILNHRWKGLEISLADVQVQGISAPDQIVAGIDSLNQSTDALDAIVVIRGGGSAEDLQAFNDERVVRAIAGSRTPTVVAIGHENDTVLAEKAADRRASTPSNAAELLVPDQNQVLVTLGRSRQMLASSLDMQVSHKRQQLESFKERLGRAISDTLTSEKQALSQKSAILSATNPESVLKRGFAILTKANDKIITSSSDLNNSDIVNIRFYDGAATAEIKNVTKKNLTKEEN